MPTVAEANKVAVQSPNAGLHIQEKFQVLLEKGIDSVFERTFDTPFQGEQFFTIRNTTKAQETFQSVVGIGNIAMNRDADVIPHDEKQLGFANTITNNVFRGRIGHERTLTEVEQYGMIGDAQKQLADAAKRTIELIMADVFNRGIDPASDGPFICEDGHPFITSDARANAHPRGGTWTNEETTGAITPDALFTAQLSASTIKSERGHLSPRTLKRVICRPTDEKTLWEILRSDLRPTDSMNARNFQFGRFEYTVYNHLTSANIFYELDGDNELYFQWRVRPSFETWPGADNPDLFWQRVRFACGVGCNRPTDHWMGMIVS